MPFTNQMKKGDLVEYKRHKVIRVGFIQKVYPRKIMAINDESGTIEYHIVPKENIIGVYPELPPHIKTFR